MIHFKTFCLYKIHFFIISFFRQTISWTITRITTLAINIFNNNSSRTKIISGFPLHRSVTSTPGPSFLETTELDIRCTSAATRPHTSAPPFSASPSKTRSTVTDSVAGSAHRRTWASITYRGTASRLPVNIIRTITRSTSTRRSRRTIRRRLQPASIPHRQLKLDLSQPMFEKNGN